MTREVELELDVDERTGRVSALWQRPRGAHAVFVFAHGAGAGMRHGFMDACAERLGKRGIATLRYQFPYMEQGSRRPSPRGQLLSTVRAAVMEGRRRAKRLPVFVGGKSMGGRMASQAIAEGIVPVPDGVIFFGFPLHPAGRGSIERADHLSEVPAPMLFLQGTRDGLASMSLLRPVCEALGQRAELHVVEGGDHSFHVLKRSGRCEQDVLDELADGVSHFVDRHV